MKRIFRFIKLLFWDELLLPLGMLIVFGVLCLGVICGEAIAAIWEKSK